MVDLELFSVLDSA